MRPILGQPGLLHATLVLPSQSLARQDGFDLALLPRGLPDWANLS